MCSRKGGKAYLPIVTKTTRWQKNENLMAFEDEGKSAAMVTLGRDSYFCIMAFIEKTETILRQAHYDILKDSETQNLFGR